MVKIVGYSAYYIYNYFKQVSRDGYLIEEVSNHEKMDKETFQPL